MNAFVGELIGTFILVLLGNGVVSACILNKTKSQNSGWIAIVLGWGFAVMVAIYVSGFLSGAHLNPAVTIAMASLGNISWKLVPLYIAAQFIGAILASLALYVHYYPHWSKTEDAGTILACFSTGPAIRHTLSNMFGEALGTAILVITVMSIGQNNVVSGFGPIIVGVVVFAIGFSLGGTTGYAINPARDLAPRLVHALLPIKNKGNSDWSYAWIPVVSPIVGGLLGAIIYNMILHLV
ncbi:MULTISPECIES: MIP/aquaporin family protein [unclassified Granulicatella]|uniref:MIP/aquaporin family protein n=1 Tax=unclassified Granulicatella TaxID=2630493 RepID=UPI00107497B3|nr:MULTISPECIES: MIP/aquaporin family protein [unclassified Granulicatella]MBF0780915.1 aquaporin family protein [Granulicatella sp. 19428wC4_WM01]TFU93213.1 aquaporin family protein [Granulicatella sp. WM01]